MQCHNCYIIDTLILFCRDILMIRIQKVVLKSCSRILYFILFKTMTNSRGIYLCDASHYKISFSQRSQIRMFTHKKAVQWTHWANRLYRETKHFSSDASFAQNTLLVYTCGNIIHSVFAIEERALRTKSLMHIFPLDNRFDERSRGKLPFLLGCNLHSKLECYR